MNREKIKEVAKTLLFNPKEEVMVKLEEIFEKLDKQISEMQQIDTTNVKPMNIIDEALTTFLREDVPGKVLDKKEFLRNSLNADDDFVILPKVVESD